MQKTNTNYSMETESNENSSGNSSLQSENRMKRFLIALNCLLLALGDTGGPLTSRLYFHHGGRRNWLSSFLETAGFPILLLPLCLNYLQRRRQSRSTPIFLITPRLFLACIGLGLLTGVDDFLYAYGLSFLPVSTAAILLSTHLSFTAFFAFLIVKQRFTFFNINSIALLTTGAALLGLHGSSDRPEGVTDRQYYMGFFLMVATAALYGLVLPLIELTYRKSRREVTYTLVMEMQLVMAASATVFCVVGMAIDKDFQAIPKEAKNFGLGEARYYVVLTWCAIFWQLFFLGTVGVIFCVNTLLAAIIVAVFIPVIEILAVIFLHERFSSEKGVAVALALWGLASYLYGEHKQAAKEKPPSIDQP
ncbi:Purine permease 3 [Rhynchospora pubera]|uniref:Probable purine permease n=1 Tax=Rhynchospora pubera TaxID=906938 RepID=A0AAV8EDN6_9POAL|nr:Purine permease 3 [Rhynchospora pubera]